MASRKEVTDTTHIRCYGENGLSGVMGECRESSQEAAAVIHVR